MTRKCLENLKLDNCIMFCWSVTNTVIGYKEYVVNALTVEFRWLYYQCKRLACQRQINPTNGVVKGVTFDLQSVWLVLSLYTVFELHV